MLFISGDLDFLLSILTGMILISKNRKEKHNKNIGLLKTGIFGGFITSISAIVISFIQLPPGQNSNSGQVILIFLLLGQFIGLFIALLFILSDYLHSIGKAKN